jgi:peptidoglycan-associated lipoprotein
MMKKLILTTAILGGSVAYAETINQPSLAPLNPQIITIDAETLNRLEESRLLVQQNLIALEEKVAVIEKNMAEMDLFLSLNSSVVYFETGSSELSTDQLNVVTEIVNFLNEYSSYTVTLEGHADARGFRGHNYRLGEERAAAVKNILVNSGVSEDRVKIVSLGQHRPASAGVNEESWKQNRRVVFVLNR